MKLKKLFRALKGPEIKIDEESRSIEFSFSSEKPVERYFGKEVLSHNAQSVNLERLNGGANVLFNHNWDMVVGVVEKAWINNEDKRGYARVRFSKNPKAEEILNDVKDGILKNVSFGYVVEEMQLSKKSDQDGEEYTATKWEPYEISLVSVPADSSVGIGRSMMYGTRNDLDEEYEVTVDNSLFNEQTQEEQGDEKEINMSEKETLKPEIDTAAIAAEARETERSRIAEISALGERFGHRDLAKQLIEGSKSVEEARSAYLEKMEIKQKPVSGTETDIGLSDKEKQSFSFLRAINAMANPQDRKLQEAAKFEFEVSEAASKKAGKSSRGMYVPNEVLRFSRRDLVVGTASAGGNLVATDLLNGSFIDLLRNKLVLGEAGMTVLSGLSGNVAIPKQTGGATAYMVAENAAPTESAQTFGQVTMSPKTLAAYVDFSRKLTVQSSMDIEAMVRNDLVKVAALKMDYLGLYGSGSSNEPSGVKVTTGVNAVNFGAAAPTYAEIVAMETAIAADNADVAQMAYLVNAAGRGVLKGVDKASGAAQFVWEPGNTVNGYKALVSNQVATPSDPDYWFGNWSDLVLGLWGGLDLMADPYTGSKEGTVRVTIFQELDFGVRHGESFCYGNNAAI